MNKTEIRHFELKEKLIASAEIIIEEQGLSALKSRDVTAAAGCSLGALYNVLRDLDNLIMYVNERTLKRMGVFLEQATSEVEPLPDAKLHALSSAYIDFAINNKNLWLALFQFRPAVGSEIPEWYRDEHSVLISQIIKPLSYLMPEATKVELIQRASTLFAAVHGVVIFAMEGGYVSIPVSELHKEVHALVTLLANGAQYAAERAET